MQVKKYEAPTLQEAMDAVKRELGPEAIILQTKKNKGGFGLLSKPSVEVTAAISDRALVKKRITETRMPEATTQQIKKMPAYKQADVIDKFSDKYLERVASGTRDQVTLSKKASVKPITKTRYIDIPDEGQPAPSAKKITPPTAPRPMVHAPQPPKNSQAEHLSESYQRGVGAASVGLATPGSLSGMSMEEELKQLKRMIQEMKNTQEEGLMGSGAQILLPHSPLGTPALQDAFEQLLVSGLDKRFAMSLLKKVVFELGPQKTQDPELVLDQLALEIMDSAEVLSLLGDLKPEARENGPLVIALVGPTGVGKTTTVAKIASEAILKRNLKVGLINMDQYKVAAFDQLGTYGKILKVPFRSVHSSEDFKAALADFHSLDLVLVDTTGRSQKDPESLKEMQDLLLTVPQLQTQLVLSVTTRDTELYDMSARFSIFKPQGIIISKLDESTLFGAIYNVSQKAQLPLVYFTTGQRVPEDIEEATKERVAALMLHLS